jgi:hypothetical protein
MISLLLVFLSSIVLINISITNEKSEDMKNTSNVDSISLQNSYAIEENDLKK